MKFNEELHQAGVLVAAEGLRVGIPGARVAVADGKRAVLDAPTPSRRSLELARSAAPTWIDSLKGR